MLVEKIPDDVLAEIQELQNRREKVENKITDLDKSIKARLEREALYEIESYRRDRSPSR